MDMFTRKQPTKSQSTQLSVVNRVNRQDSRKGDQYVFKQPSKPTKQPDNRHSELIINENAEKSPQSQQPFQFDPQDDSEDDREKCGFSPKTSQQVRQPMDRRVSDVTSRTILDTNEFQTSLAPEENTTPKKQELAHQVDQSKNQEGSRFNSIVTTQPDSHNRLFSLNENFMRKKAGEISKYNDKLHSKCLNQEDNNKVEKVSEMSDVLLQLQTNSRSNSDSLNSDEKMTQDRRLSLIKRIMSEETPVKKHFSPNKSARSGLKDQDTVVKISEIVKTSFNHEKEEILSENKDFNSIEQQNFQTLQDLPAHERLLRKLTERKLKNNSKLKSMDLKAAEIEEIPGNSRQSKKSKVSFVQNTSSKNLRDNNKTEVTKRKLLHTPTPKSKRAMDLYQNGSSSAGFNKTQTTSTRMLRSPSTLAKQHYKKSSVMVNKTVSRNQTQKIQKIFVDQRGEERYEMKTIPEKVGKIEKQSSIPSPSPLMKRQRSLKKQLQVKIPKTPHSATLKIKLEMSSTKLNLDQKRQKIRDKHFQSHVQVKTPSRTDTVSPNFIKRQSHKTVVKDNQPILLDQKEAKVAFEKILLQRKKQKTQLITKQESIQEISPLLIYQQNSKKQTNQVNPINAHKFHGALNYTDIDEYKLDKMLGQGAYAMVREAIHISTGFKVAIKIYDKYKLNTAVHIKKSIQREIKILSLISRTCLNTTENLYDSVSNISMESLQIMKSYSEDKRKNNILGHPSVMKLYDAIDTQRHLYLIIEYCEGQMLSSLMKEHLLSGQGRPRKNLPESLCAKIFYNIIQGMAYFHSMNISHRDLKLENVLVDMNSENFQTKIIDFGFATQTQTPDERMKVFCGTPEYMSPELCGRKEYCGPINDVWAAGIILYALMFGQQPFRAHSEAELYKKIQKGAYTFPKSSHPDMNHLNPQKMHSDSSLHLRSPKAKESKDNYQNTMPKNQAKMSSKNLLQSAFKIQDIDAIDPMSGHISYSKEVKALIKDILQKDEMKRPTATGILIKYQNWFRQNGIEC